MFDWVPAWLRWAFGALVMALVAWWFVLPQFDEASDALELVADVDPVRLIAAGALVAAAFVAQAQMTRSVIPRHERPQLFDMVRIGLASAAVSHTVPGGTAAGTALGFRLLTRAGVSGTSAGFAVGVRGLGSALVLNLALWLALAMWIPMNGFRANFGVAAAVGVLALFAVGLLLVVVLRAEERTIHAIGKVIGAIPGLDADDAEPVIDRAVDQLRDFLTNRPLAVRVGGWAGVHWLSEAASLWIILAAFGWSGDPLAVFVAFGVVNVLAVIPVTPRGLGIVEAVLIPMLIALGAPGQVAALGVVAWRLLAFWAPIPIGTVSYVSLRAREPEVGEPEVGEDVPDRRRLALEELASARHPNASAAEPHSTSSEDVRSAARRPDDDR